MNREKRAGAGGFSPMIVFAVLLILVVGGAVFAMTRPQPSEPAPATSPQSTPSPMTHRLSDAEAVAELKRLEALSYRAFEERELRLLERVYTESSPLLKKAAADIRRLSQDQTQVAIRSHTRQIVVRKSDVEEMTFVQVAVIETKFSPETGRDSTGGGRELQRIRWVLRRAGDQWFVYDSVVLDVQPCPSPKC